MSKHTLTVIAKKIPAEYRKRILEENLIYKAVSNGSDPHMKVLFTVWKKYVQPYDTTLTLECSYCVENIFKNFRAIQETLVELEKADKLLDL